MSALAAGAHAASLTEAFDSGVPTGWTVINHSSVPGDASWFQGNPLTGGPDPLNPGPFDAQAGATDSYAGVNYNSVRAGSPNYTISNWLISPTLSFNNGDVVSFYTRGVENPTYADRLELRFSKLGGVDVGTSDASVGSFTTLLLTVNPALLKGAYPGSWTQFSAPITALSGPISGAIAFRYFVTNGGPDGANGDLIAIDTLNITAVPEPGTSLLMALGLGAFALRRRRA